MIVNIVKVGRYESISDLSNKCRNVAQNARFCISVPPRFRLTSFSVNSFVASTWFSFVYHLFLSSVSHYYFDFVAKELAVFSFSVCPSSVLIAIEL